MTPHVTFRHLQVFVSVAREGTVIAAANTLNLSQSATSQALSDMEKQLGAVLFERLGRRLRLNPLGEFLLPRAEHLLDGMAAFVAAAEEPDGGLRGTLQVSASTTVGAYVLPALVGDFCTANASADVRMRLRNTQMVMADLLRLDADMGVIEGVCHEPRLVSQAWRSDQLLVICAPDHPLARQGQLRVGEVGEQEWILREPGSGTRRVFEAAVRHHTERLTIRMELAQNDAIKQAVMAGLGLGCLSQLSVAGELERGELVALRTPLNLARSFSLVWHPERYRSPLWQAFKVYLMTHAQLVTQPPPGNR